MGAVEQQPRTTTLFSYSATKTLTATTSAVLSVQGARSMTPLEGAQPLPDG